MRQVKVRQFLDILFLKIWIYFKSFNKNLSIQQQSRRSTRVFFRWKVWKVQFALVHSSSAPLSLRLTAPVRTDFLDPIQR